MMLMIRQRPMKNDNECLLPETSFPLPLPGIPDVLLVVPPSQPPRRGLN